MSVVHQDQKAWSISWDVSDEIVSAIDVKDVAETMGCR
jgi:hypothetical protein